MTALFELHLESRQGHIPSFVHSSEWSTPVELFEELNREFSFTLDVCASPGNAKCARYFTRSKDGLQQPWRAERCWMNPPYARGVIDQWMARAAADVSAADGADLVVCLVPASTSTAWWHDSAMQGEVRFIRGRLTFGGAKNSAMFASALVIFRRVPAEVTR